MRVKQDSVVAIEYTIRNSSGRVIDTTRGRRPFIYVHGHDEIVPSIEAALAGRGAGSTVQLSISPHEAYGERIADALRVIPRHMFPGVELPEIGSLYRAVGVDGHITFLTVVDVTSESVVVDTNHPLAGETLDVLVQVVSVMESGHAAATC